MKTPKRSAKRTPKRTPKRSTKWSKRTSGSVREAKGQKAIAERVSAELPPFMKEMNMTSSIMSCETKKDGMLCTEKQQHVVCKRLANGTVKCNVNGKKYKCTRDNTGQMKCVKDV